MIEAPALAASAERHEAIASPTAVAVAVDSSRNGQGSTTLLLSPEARFTANCAILAQRRPEILKDLQQFPLTNLQLGPLACGEVGGQAWDIQSQAYIPLCHHSHPMAGAEADAENVYSRDIKVFILIGLGLGYFATALARRLRPWQRLLILDLDPCMFKAALYAVDIQSLFRDDGRRIDIFVGPEITAQAVEPWFMNLDAQEKLHLSVPLRTGYTGVYRKTEYDALYNKCMEMLVFHAVGLSTWRQFGPCIGDNDLLNLPEYFQCPGYEHLRDLWKDKPAICVAAGPSLHKNLRVLCDPALRSRVALIAAGTVYAFLTGIGLAPEIVTTIDFQRLNWTDQFQYVPFDLSCALVYLHSTYPQTVRRWPGPRFVAENASDTMNIFRPFAEGKKSAAIVQTVAHLSLLVALELGANPIILLGQDLSMPYDSHHSAGTRAEDLAPADAPVGAFIDTIDFEGKPVKTRHSFMSMKTVFERIIAEHPDRTILNCSEAGVALAGAQNMPLRDTLHSLRDMPLPGPLRLSLAQAWKGYVPHVSEHLIPALHDIQREVSILATMAGDVQKFAREMGYATASTQQWIMQHEQVIQARPRAWGLFAIRDFRILELMASIPTEDALSTEMLIRNRVICERMLLLAGYITENTHIILRLLRLTLRRLKSMNTTQDPRRLLALQHYFCVQRTMTQAQETALVRYPKYLYDTQQYGAALAVMKTWNMHPRRVARIEQHLARYRRTALQALPHYFVSPHDGDLHEVWDTREKEFVARPSA